MYTKNNPNPSFFSLSGSSSTILFFATNSVNDDGDDDGNDEEEKDTGVDSGFEGNRYVDGSFLITLGPTSNDSVPCIKSRRTHKSGRILRRFCVRENIMDSVISFVCCFIAQCFVTVLVLVLYSASLQHFTSYVIPGTSTRTVHDIRLYWLSITAVLIVPVCTRTIIHTRTIHTVFISTRAFTSKTDFSFLQFNQTK